jgi:hypothetical protein
MSLETYTFQVELIFEPSFDSMMVSIDYDTEDPQSIIEGAWEADFTNDILQNISIIPHSYEEA